MVQRSDRPRFFQNHLIPDEARLVGWAAIVQEFGIKAPVRKPSAVAKGHIKGSQRTEGGWTLFDKRYWPGNSVIDHLVFALRHETVDLLILKLLYIGISPGEVAGFIRATPKGMVNRRIWFFYELLTGTTLDIEDAPMVTAIDVLDPGKYFTGKPVLARRYRVRDNLLGGGDVCPIIRRTEVLEECLSRNLASEAAAIIGRTGAHLITRAAGFLLLADSRASFEIEGERAPRNRLERWGRVVMHAGRHPLSIDELNRLHGILIKDTRFIHPGLRPDDIFLGDRDPEGYPLPEFIGARPEDLTALLTGLFDADRRMAECGLDPVLQATATAFGFIYIHPHQDGNGRLHRYLIHHILAERGFSSEGMVFPISSVMLDRIGDYRATLQNHSGPLFEYIDWRPTPDRNVEVTNETADLYRYYDCTEEAEFLYSCVARTIEHDLPREIDFLRRQDEAERRIGEMIEMPDRLIRDLIMFIRQNGGSIPKRRRENEFASLTDEESGRIEAIYMDVFSDEPE